MVRVSASGEIIRDDKQPVNQNQPNYRSSRIGRINSPQDGGGEHGNQPQGGGMGGAFAEGGQGRTVFDTWNEKLLQLGIPRWNIGSHVVEPIMTTAMVVVLLMFGLPGVLFLGLLYFVVTISQQRPQAAASTRRPPPSGFSGGGRRLGRS
uniref:DUF4605 domain-containing protein n=1 Tax=Ciona intestinalis TaxID=7719 RepID=F6Z531_CIOIN|nr:uncharacterized protein FAM241B-like [Ciona intestinalis]|eukprot:XP_002129267.1 uncharacterized protein FAM241B-like [Ciona intestinalis]